MVTTSAVSQQADLYQLRLPMFSGPLDVLLRLIERDQLEISEVSLVAVLDQFMDHMYSLDSPDASAIAEFVVVAGRLSVLKSRALLPKPARAPDDDEEPDLVRQLEDYRAVKAAAALLAARQREGFGVFGRGQSIACPAPAFTPHSPQSPAALAKAVRRWITRIPAHPMVHPTRPTVSLRGMIARISLVLESRGSTTFDSIRLTCEGRQDTAVAFLALLILLRRQSVRAYQLDVFGPIELERIGTTDSARDVPLIGWPEEDRRGD